jgi:hypothetical protein
LRQPCYTFVVFSLSRKICNSANMREAAVL